MRSSHKEWPRCAGTRSSRNVEAITQTPGLDVVFVGPADLSTDLGVPGDLDAPVFKAAITRIVTAARQAGIASGILSRNADHAAACREDGFSFVGVGSDATLLAASANAVTKQVAHRSR